MKTLTNQQKEAIHRLEPIARLATVQEVNWLIRPSVWAFLLYWWANKWITISAYLNMPLSCIADWVPKDRYERSRGRDHVSRERPFNVAGKAALHVLPVLDRD